MDISSCGCTCTNGPMSNHLPSKWMVRSQEHLYKASTYKRRGSQNCRIPYVHKLSNENANVYKFYFWCKMSSWHKQILKCFKYTLVHSGAASTFHRLVQMMVSEKCHKPEVGRGQIPDNFKSTICQVQVQRGLEQSTAMWRDPINEFWSAAVALSCAQPPPAPISDLKAFPLLVAYLVLVPFAAVLQIGNRSLLAAQKTTNWCLLAFHWAFANTAKTLVTLPAYNSGFACGKVERCDAQIYEGSDLK